MSKNFELIQRAAKEDLLTPSSQPGALEGAIPAQYLASSATGDVTRVEIDKLVQRLFLQGGELSGPKVVSFSGAAEDNRSSWICARAGESLASQVDASVCVVDTNVASLLPHTNFVSSNRTELVVEPVTDNSVQSIATPLSRGNLWLMPMPFGLAKGDIYRHASQCRALFADLRDRFNYILISGPPLTRETEAILIGRLADGIVLIVEANQTRRRSVREAKERLRSAEIDLLGAVLDQRTFPIPNSLYQKL